MRETATSRASGATTVLALRWSAGSIRRAAAGALDKAKETSKASGVMRMGLQGYVESAGRPSVWNEAVSTMGRRGRVLVCGAHGGPLVDLNLSWLFRNRVSIIGSAGARRSVFADAVQLAADQLAAGRPLIANIDSIRPLDDVRSAFERLSAGANRGKIILDVTSG